MLEVAQRDVPLAVDRAPVDAQGQVGVARLVGRGRGRRQPQQDGQQQGAETGHDPPSAARPASARRATSSIPVAAIHSSDRRRRLRLPGGQRRRQQHARVPGLALAGPVGPGEPQGRLRVAREQEARLLALAHGIAAQPPGGEPRRSSSARAA